MQMNAADDVENEEMMPLNIKEYLHKHEVS